jgi:hypothetical protein
MTKRTLLLAALLVPALLSFDDGGPLNKPIPILAGKTLDGQTVDAGYYKGHVTVVTFMFIGCMGCMNEIGLLNKLHDTYAGNDKVQILCIARQQPDQMIAFNRNKKSVFGQLRKAMNTDTIKYAIMPACDAGPSKMQVVKTWNGTDSNEDVQLKSECTTIEKTYGFNSFPMMYFVDKNGIVRNIEEGGPPTQNDMTFYDRYKSWVDKLLAE